MIYLIGNPTEWKPDYEPRLFQVFKNWISTLHEVEFDIETNVIPWWCDKVLITVQFGWQGTEWVLQWSELNESERAVIKEILENKLITKLIHNAAFECTVMLFNNIRVQGVYDTMLAEMVLYGGEHTIEYGLDDCIYRRFNIILDKTQQTAFSDNILTPEKVIYAAQDVKHLANLRTKIVASAREVKYDTFEKVVELENSIVPAFAEMVYHGMELDKEWWLKLASDAQPLVSAAEQKLNEWLQQEPFRSVALMLGYLSDKDRVLVNWNSPKQKAQLFQELYPQLPGTTKAVLQKYLSTQIKTQQSYPEWLPYYLDGDYSLVDKEIVQHHRDWLIENGYLIPAGQSSINWSSTDQALPVFQAGDSKLKALNQEAKGRSSLPALLDYDEYLDTKKLLTTYGEAFIYGVETGPKKKLPKVEPDGKVRTRFKQVLTTGRISSANPNMQNIPSKESVGNKYRNAFIVPEGWNYVSSDYVS